MTSLYGLWCLANGQTFSETCQGLTGLQELIIELIAALQHLRQLLQLPLHLITVLLIDCVHVLLHLLAGLCHLGKDNQMIDQIRAHSARGLSILYTQRIKRTQARDGPDALNGFCTFSTNFS